MKNFFLMLIAILVGTNGLFAQDANKETDLALYQQAVKAIKDKKFVLRANQYIDENGVKQYNVSPITNYITLNGETVVMSFNYGDRKWAYEGKVKKFDIKEDKKGNVNLRMNVKSPIISVIQLNFTINKGGNHCLVVGNPIKYFKKFVFIGELVTYDISNLAIPHVW